MEPAGLGLHEKIERFEDKIREKDEVLDRQREQIKMLQATTTRLRQEKEALSEAQRVVLVKPGDILLIGNVGEMRPEDARAIAAAMAADLSIRIAIFEDDIELDLLSAEQLAQIVAARAKGEANG